MDHKHPEEFLDEEGTVLCKPITPDSLQRAKNLDLTSQDVMVVSYLKSGTTWLKYITQLILNPDMLGDTMEKYDLQENVPYLEFTFLLEEALAKPPPRLFTSHLSFRSLRHYIEEKKVKVIFIRRDLRDTLTSYYYFYQMCATLGNLKGTFHDFFHLFKNKRLMYGDPVAFNQEWWDARESYNILHVTYEELKQDVHGAITKIAKFLDRNVTEEAVQKIAELSSFDEMKSNPQTNGSIFVNMGLMDFSISPFIRKGKVGDWKDHFNSEEEAFLKERLKETTVPYG